MSFKKGNDSNFPGWRQSMDQSPAVILTLAFLSVALGNAGTAMGVPPCCAAGGSSGWSGEDLLNNIGSEGSNNQQAKVAGPSANSEPVESEKSILIQPSQVTSKDVILNVDTKQQSYIKGAVHIDYREFMDTSGRPKSTLELSRILGNAGISRSDSLVIYSENTSAASDVYQILDSLGQQSIRILYGGLKGWTIAGKPTESTPAVLAHTSYLFGML